MKVKLVESDEVKELTTGQARRAIQAGEAIAVEDAKTVEHGDDDKPKPRAKRPAKDSGADAPAG